MLLLNVVSVFLPNIAIAVIMFRTGERTVYIMTAVITMLISIIVFTMVIVPTVSRIGHRGS
jgi:membrane protein YdbS with pleckstrin-like domain